MIDANNACLSMVFFRTNLFLKYSWLYISIIYDNHDNGYDMKWGKQPIQFCHLRKKKVAMYHRLLFANERFYDLLSIPYIYIYSISFTFFFSININCPSSVLSIDEKGREGQERKKKIPVCKSPSTENFFFSGSMLLIVFGDQANGLIGGD